MPRSSERGHLRTAPRYHRPSHRGVTDTQLHARNSVANLRPPRLPEPRSVIPTSYLLRPHRQVSKSGNGRSRSATHSCVCPTLAAPLFPVALRRRVARRAQQAAARGSHFQPTHHPLHPTRPRTSASQACDRTLALRTQSVGHPPALADPTRGIPRESFFLWLERRIGVHRPPRHTRGRARPTVRVASRNPF